MKETLYVFRLDKQFRVTVPMLAREMYFFDKIVYLKLQVIEGVKYLQISGKKLDYYQASVGMDAKGRFIIPKEAREKLDLKVGDKLDSFDTEIDSDDRTLLLKKV